MTRPRIKRIHVNQFVIRSNQRNHSREPPLRVKTSSYNVRATEVVIEGPCRVIYRPDRPLSCGARVWIETTSLVSVVDAAGHERLIG